MESTNSPIYMCPSFNRNSSNDIADIADRVVQELRLENGFPNDDVFSFSDEDNPQVIHNNNKQEVINNMNMMPTKVQEEEDDEHEFEFPVICGNSNSYSSPVSVSDTTYQKPVQYPVFDQSLLSETELNVNSNGRVDLNSPEPVQSTRPSLRKLLSEDRDAPSTSSSDADDLDGVTPGTYCVWKPKENKEPPRGKHKKSNSVSINNISKRWKVRDLLKRSYSDDSYSTGKDSPVVVFLQPISPKPKTNGEKMNKSEKTGKTESNIPVSTKPERNIPASTKPERNIPASTKPERNIPAYRTKIGNIRVPPYLPYRQGQVAAFSNFNGSSNMYRY